MEWRDDAIVIGVRRHGETSAVAELMTRSHGRHFGLVRGGRSRRLQPVLQQGNEVQAVWRARLEDQLGTYAVEPAELHAAAALDEKGSLRALNFLCGLLRLLAERDPHPAAFEAAALVLRRLGDLDVGPPLMARFELAMLQELGFGLDLERCAATGERIDLAYVSPRTGRAVSRHAGEPWKDKLFPLPSFLRPGSRGAEPSPEDVAAAFRISGHFLARDVLEPRGLAPMEARSAYIGWIEEIRVSRRKPGA